MAGSEIRPEPMPPITPKNNISNGTLILNGDKASPIAATILPEIQTGLNPNLLTNPPVIGPNIELIPKQREATNDIEGLSDLNSFIKGCKRTPPKVNPKPSEISKLFFVMIEIWKVIRILTALKGPDHFGHR